jgi:uncharacterized membrane protein YfcA
MTLAAILAYSALLLVGGVFSTISGGGLGILTVILGSFFLDPRISIVFVLVLFLSVQIVKLWNFRSYVRWSIVGWYVLGGIPLSYVGGLLLFSVPPRLPAILLGTYCICFIISRFWKIAPKLGTSKSILIASGAVNGFIGGLVGNAALLRMSALMAMGMSKEIFVGTSSAIALLMNLGKVAAYVPNIPFDRNTIILMSLSIPTVFISVAIGKRLLTYVSVQLFEDLQLLVILAGAVKLLFFP